MLNMDAAQQRLTPHADALFVEPYKSAVDTWHEFVRESPTKAAPLDESTRANMIHNWVTDQVRVALQDQDLAREVSVLGFFAVALGADILVRYKLVNAGRPSNVRTVQQQNIEKQRYDEDAMGMLEGEGFVAPPTILTCGYRLDFAAQLTRVELRFDYAAGESWSWPLWAAEDIEVVATEQTAFPNMPEAQPAVVRSTKRDAAGEAATSEGPN